jgi:hypothetical protein
MFQDRGESKRLTVATDADKLSVKKLIEEEMFIDQDEIKDQGNNVVESLKPDSKRKRKSRKKSRDMDTNDPSATLKSEFSHNQHSNQQSKDNIDLDKIMKDFCQIERACSSMHGDDNSKMHDQSNQKNVNSEELARDAIHDFVNQKILNGKDMVEDKKFLCSNEVLEIESESTFSHDLGHVDTAEAGYPVGDEIVAEGTSSKYMIQIIDTMINFSLCSCVHLLVFFHLSFLNFCAGNVEFTKDINVLESSSNPNDCIAGKDQQNHDIAEIPDDGRCSECLNQLEWTLLRFLSKPL